MKQPLFNLLPPLTVAAILAFWAFAPTHWVDTWWTITAVGLVVLAFVQLLECVHERHEGWRISQREFFTDSFYVVLSITAISWLVDALANSPMEKAKEALGISTPWLTELPFVVQAALVVLLFEFGQYWMHRLMHHNAWFWSTHAPHHHLTQLNAMKGYVGNPIELFLISLGVVAFLDFDKAPMLAGFSILTVIPIYAHANLRADPPRWFSFFFTTIRYHSLHHTALSFEDTRCNYGNCVILFDRLFGTFRDGESVVVGQDERKRLSIQEQFLFPFRPWLERIKAN